MDKETRKALGKVIARSWDDAGYKARLLSDPRAALAEAGVDVPGGMEITVSEQQPGALHLTLPPRPEDEGVLDEEALEAVSGGHCSCTTLPCACW